MQTKPLCCCIFLVSFAFFISHSFAAEVPLKKQGGVYKLPVLINQVITLDFILDSGASEVVIPGDVVMTLIRSGTISESDFLPGKTYSLADGSKLTSARFIIREFELGGIKINKVPCAIAPVAGDLLLGQTLLSKMASWTLDNKRHVLILGEPENYGSDSAIHPSETTQVPSQEIPQESKFKTDKETSTAKSKAEKHKVESGQGDLPPSQSGSASRKTIIHEVAPMESIWRLAKMYDVTEKSICEAILVKD